MRKLTKKISSVFLVAAMFLTMFSGFSAFAEDVEQTKLLHDGEEGLLRYLEVLKEENPDYGKTVTRGELAYMAARIMNSSPSNDTTALFYDVPSGHPYFQDINALALAGIVAGDGSGFYNPDTVATELDLCKIYSILLGYDALAQYETYLKTAQRAGILEGVSNDGVLTYAEALRATYDTLHAEMCEATAYGDKKSYTVREGYYAIERYHGLVKQRGVVDGVYGSTLSHPDQIIPEGCITIEDTIFECADTGLFGKEVVFYSKRSDGERPTEKKIAYIYADEERNNILTIAGEDVIGKSGDIFSYWKNNAEKKVNLIRAVDVIYNGVAYPKYKAEDLKPVAGTVTLIDNNDDTVYDVISVESYQYIIANGVDAEKNLLYSQYPGGVLGSSTQENKILIYNEKGFLHPSTIKAGDVLAVAITKNDTGIVRINVYPLASGVTGTISTMTDNKIVIANKEYSLTNATTIDSKLKNGVQENPIRLGDNVSLYMHNGTVAVITRSQSTDYQFGYLVNIRNAGGAFSSKLGIQLVDEKRTMHEYTAANKFKLDESLYTDYNLIEARILAAAANTYNNAQTKWKYSQPVRYRLNTDGELTHLDTNLYDDRVETKDSLQLSVPATSLRIFKDGKSMIDASAGKIAFSFPDLNNSDYFVIADGFRDDPTIYGNYGNFEGYGTYIAEAYNIDPENYYAQYVVFYSNEGSGGEIPADSRRYIVSDIVSTLDEEGYPIKQMSLIMARDGVTHKYSIDSAVNVDGIEAGDVVSILVTDGEITKIDSYIDVSAPAPELSKRIVAGTSNFYEFAKLERLSYGTILTYKNKVITHTNSVGGELVAGERNGVYNYLEKGAVNYFVYDRNAVNPQVKACSSADIVAYGLDPNTTQNAIMFTHAGNLQCVYILK